MEKVCVLGTGSWGSALGLTLAMMLWVGQKDGGSVSTQ